MAATGLGQAADYGGVTLRHRRSGPGDQRSRSGPDRTLTAKLVQASDTDAIQESRRAICATRESRLPKTLAASSAPIWFWRAACSAPARLYASTAYLVDSKTHRQIAARNMTVDAGDTFGLQDRVVSETLNMSPARIKPEQGAKVQRSPKYPASRLRSVHTRSRLHAGTRSENLDKVIVQFTNAVHIDRNYALGYATLG